MQSFRENEKKKGDIFTAFRIRPMEVHPGPLATPLRNHQKLRRNTESNPAEKQKIFINTHKSTNNDSRILVYG